LFRLCHTNNTGDFLVCFFGDCCSWRAPDLDADDDVVDGDENQLDEEANETHDQETGGGRVGDLGEL
jgi:hypothetical protein